MARMRSAGVRGVLVPAVEQAGWARLRTLSARHGWRYALGTHPHALPRSRAIPDELDGASAIGECGLDGGVPVAMEEQQRVLEAHLAVARDAGLPVVLHCWKAHPQLVALLRKWRPVVGVVHSYSGGVGLVDAYVELGLHLSFSGVICRADVRRPLESLRRVPASRLLLETDAPDQTPRPSRARNEPSLLPEIVAAAERARGEPLAERLAANAEALFGRFPGEAPGPAGVGPGPVGLAAPASRPPDAGAR